MLGAAFYELLGETGISSPDLFLHLFHKVHLYVFLAPPQGREGRILVLVKKESVLVYSERSKEELSSGKIIKEQLSSGKIMCSDTLPSLFLRAFQKRNHVKEKRKVLVPDIRVLV